MTDYAELLRDLRDLPPVLREAAAAADAIESLQAECERLRSEVAAGDMAFHEEADTVSRLRAELAAAQKDAERYQWLRGRVPGGAYRIMGVIYSDGGKGVDKAIDAAMAQEKP